MYMYSGYWYMFVYPVLFVLTVTYVHVCCVDAFFLLAVTSITYVAVTPQTHTGVRTCLLPVLV